VKSLIISRLVIGINSRKDLMDSNYKTIQDDLAKAGITPHLNIFYSIEMGLQGKSWQEITPIQKQEIRNALAYEKY
jgi:hypothetical protein